MGWNCGLSANLTVVREEDLLLGPLETLAGSENETNRDKQEKTRGFV